jgi:hypothetical protein
MATDDNGALVGEAVGRGVELADGVHLTTAGARITGELTLDNYVAAVERCELLGNAAVWALGDLLYYGEKQASWGEKYTQAMALTGRSYWSLTQCMRVAKAYPLDARVTGASWSHHRVALSIPPEERTALLEGAVTSNVSAEGLRQQIATSNAPAPRTLTCPNCNHEWVPE